MRTRYYAGMTTGYDSSHSVGFSSESEQIAKGWIEFEKSESSSRTLIMPPVLLPGMRRVVDQVKELSHLEDDWDGDDATAPTPTIVSDMVQLVNLLDKAMRHAQIRSQPPKCCPTPVGGIQLYWRGEDFYLSLLVEPWLPGQIIVLHGDGKTTSTRTHLSFEGAVKFSMERLQSVRVGR